MPVPGPLELILILVIVAMLFGVGKLPEVFGSVGKGIREFRKEASVEPSDSSNSDSSNSATASVAPAAPDPAIEAPVESASNGQSA